MESLFKEKSLTQHQLADIIGISDKNVSKWETENRLPEVSLMIPLCYTLNINVNKLFSGERLTDSNYNKEAEENIIDLIKEREDSKAKIVISIIECSLILLSGVTLILLSGILEMDTWLLILLIVIAIIVTAGGIGVAAILDMSSGTFECEKCENRFTPTPGAYIAGPHTIITKRKLKCPNCGNISYCKKRLIH